jgi:mono/diheme cytochrome c family protein
MKASITLRVLLAAMFLGSAFLWRDLPGASGQRKSNKPDAVTASAEQLMQAKTTFKDKCSRCHGSDGKADTVLGDMLFPPDFTDGKWGKEVTNERLMQSITNGKDEMPAFGKKLTKPEILALIAYVRCFEKSAAYDERKVTCD